MRTRLAPLALVPLLLTACQSGGAGKPDALASTPSPTASSGAGTPATTIPTKRAATSTAAPTTAARSTATSAPAPVPAARPVTTVAPGKPAASRASAPGTYALDSSGSISYGTPPQKKDAGGSQTLTVTALKNGSQTATTKGDQGDTAETFLVRDAGTYLADLTITTPAFTKEYRPATAVLFVPDPATPGMTWSYGGKTTDGKTSIAVSNSVARTETLTIGGRKVPCAVLQSHLVLSGDIDYTVDLTTWWSPELRLPVKDHSKGNGSFGGFAFTTDITDVMRSTVPS